MPNLDTYKTELDGDILNAASKDLGNFLFIRAAIAAIQQTAGQVTVTTTVTETIPSVPIAGAVALAANVNRKGALIINISATDVFLSLSGTATLNKGIPLKAGGGAYEINTTNLYRGVISAIASAATSLLVSEGV